MRESHEHWFLMWVYLVLLHFDVCFEIEFPSSGVKRSTRLDTVIIYLYCMLMHDL